MFCPKCGVEAGMAPFCPNCGNAMNAAAPNPMGSTFSNNAYSNPNPGYNTYNPAYAAPVENFNLITAFTSMFKKYAQFNGRSRRSEYWWSSVACGLITMIVWMLFILPNIKVYTLFGETYTYVDPSADGIVGFAGILLVFFGLACIVPALAMTCRRLHDIGKSGTYMLFALIPLVGGIILFVFTLMDSQPGPNMYGPNPKGM